MYEIKIRGGFSAAHRLKGYKGKCENMHGHNWEVEAVFSSDKLNPLGMVVDFAVAKKILKQVLKNLDHSFLNRHPYFKKQNPTAELIARYIYKQLSRITKRKRSLGLKEVLVSETHNTYAKYSE